MVEVSAELVWITREEWSSWRRAKNIFYHGHRVVGLY